MKDLFPEETPQARDARLRGLSVDELGAALDGAIAGDAVWLAAYGHAGCQDHTRAVLAAVASRCGESIARLRPHAPGEAEILSNALAFAVGRHDLEGLRHVAEQCARATREAGL